VVRGASIERSLPLVEEILAPWKATLGDEFLGYRNHVYRMIHFCCSLRALEVEEREKVMIAACFHDLGIWVAHSLDYIPPSIELAKEYLERRNLRAWAPEIETMIAMHHKLTAFRDSAAGPLVEIFRRGDLVDLSTGIIKSGLSKDYVADVKNEFPDEGFHRLLARLTGAWLRVHPLSAPPIFRW
jgi:hypothetical protein